tara:strand:+ start:132 stop:632 length:501 start_codon:yes stop_codon:yes gene_type:complete
MGRKRNMPSKKNILLYWQDEFNYIKDDNTCFRCESTSLSSDYNAVERCHILSVCDGGCDDVSNIQLLCSDCHKKSEGFSGELYNLWVKIDNDISFMEILITLYHKKLLKTSNVSAYSLFKEMFTVAENTLIEQNGKDYYYKEIERYSERWSYVIKNYTEECRDKIE